MEHFLFAAASTSGRWPSVLLAGMVLAVGAARGGAEDLTVLGPSSDGVAPGKQLELWLKHEFYRHVERRSEAFEKLTSAADCRAWQEARRAFFLRQIGGLPPRTPLNPQVVGTLQGEGYRVEKILFESRPGHHVTANLYLPDSQPPWPGVLVPCGHSHEGKAAGAYQRICILLARHGMAALCYDPIGQGERYQIIDASRRYTHFDLAPRLPVPHPHVHVLCTHEHTHMGLGCILLGHNVAQYRIWDGMRAIDYLQSRPDIRADRIGCTGNSGGGTLTAYLMALDDRIVAAAPVCYLTTFRRLIDSSGPQDAEQNIFGQIAFGMDEADYVLMRAPRPTLICNGTRDATFDIRGAWELFREAKRFYSRLGHAERVELHEADAPHGFTIQQREAAARWLCRWLLGQDKPIRELENRPDPITDEQLRELNKGDWSAQQLQCTPQGQVLLLPGERSVFRINVALADELRAARSHRWRGLSLEERRNLVRQTIGARSLAQLPRPRVTRVGCLERAGYSIHKLVLTVDEGLRLPALAFVPAKPDGSAVLYLHGNSMTEDAAVGGPIEQLVRQGRLVLAAELRGIGETETGKGKPDWARGHFGRDLREIFLAYLIGKSYVCMRVEDVLLWTEALRQTPLAGKPPRELHLVAIGEAAIPALHAAALDADCHSVTLRQMIPSWEEIVRTPLTFDQAVNVVHGALKHYDLPQLVELVGQERVKLQDPANVLGKPIE